MASIQTLDQDLVNHIAAGEVVERPASVLKELLENALDAGATKIAIRAKKGGIDLIEVADNGSGIAKDDLSVIAKPHSTSKISEIADLERIDSLGFRGEALASIGAVSELSISSFTGTDRSASSVEITNGVRQPIASASREKGTTVSVRSLFKAVPARHKFLKLPTTEYRKLVEVFIPNAIVHPDVHFTFESDGKIVYNLPAIKGASSRSLHPQRVKELFPHLNLIEIFYDGEGVLVGGFAGHPRHQGSKVESRFVFVNGRPIWDNGIARSVLVGAARFIVDGMKIPFFVSISVPHTYVDVNVHPRKLEVRFANPYRVYSAVEAAVKRAFQDSLREDIIDKEEIAANRLRPSETGVVSSMDREMPGDTYQRRESESSFRRMYPSRNQVEASLSFSRRLLEDANSFTAETEAVESDAVLERPAFTEPIQIDTQDHISARQYLNRYIVAEVGGNLLIVDQHAAAERIRFEKLLSEYDTKQVETQSLMIPVELKLSDTEALFVEETKGILESIGYGCSVINDKVEIASVPAILQVADHESIFKDIIGELQEIEIPEGSEQRLNEKYRDSIFATMACHSSVRMNQRISDHEATSLVKDLFQCKNAYSCPHGRPIIWRVTPKEIDEKFNR